MNCDEYFKQLGTIKQNQVKTIHHLSNFTQYLEHDVIPSGLHIKLLPQTPGSDSNSLNRKWDQTLFHCSKRLLIFLKNHCEEHLKKLTTEFHSLLDICKKDLLASEYENISKRLNDFSAMQSLALNKRQRSKFHRDGVSHQPAPSTDKQKKRRNRHFKRRSRVINNNSHTVVNLSSHQLTESETSLLSGGLNFCPVPGPINETKLSEELDNFARSLRIKEHFGSKEVERGDEVSSDSDSEETCNYRFVKKSESVPKPI